jgi:hypothetical protein
MSAAKTVGLVVLAVLLLTTTAAANVVTTSERTVLNAEFVDQSLADGGGYSELRAQILDTVDDQVAQANPTESDQIPSVIQDSINTRDIVSDAVTESYVRNQSRANLFRLYDFLHGDREDIALRVDLTPLKANLADAVGESVSDVNVSVLVDQYAPVTGEVPIEISGDRVRTMRSSQSSYQDVRDEVRMELREVALDRLVDRSFDEASNDELLVLIGENPREYTEQEKQNIVTEREAEIRQQIRQRIEEEDDDRLQEEIDQELADRAEQSKQRARAETRDATSQFSDTVTQAAIDLQLAVIDGVATDTSYEEFSSRIDTTEQNLDDEASRLAAEQIDREVPSNISVTEDLSAQDREALTMASTRVQQIDTVNVVLPILALVLVGLIYLLTRSLATTAFTTGISVGLVGLVTFVGATLARAPIETTIRNEFSGQNAQGIQDILVGLIEQILGVLGTQSLLLVGVGIVLILVGVADRRGYLADLTSSGTAAGTGADGQSQSVSRDSTQPRSRESRQQTQQSPSTGDEGVEPADTTESDPPADSSDDET